MKMIWKLMKYEGIFGEKNKKIVNTILVPTLKTGLGVGI